MAASHPAHTLNDLSGPPALAEWSGRWRRPPQAVPTYDRGEILASREVKILVRRLKEQGWRVEETRKNHYMAFSPDGVGKVTIPGTSSDHRSLRNVVAILRRYGYQEQR